jgi:hypothetical protein
MKVAIVGFPFSGKSNLFTAVSGLSREQLKVGEETLAAVRIPEPRLDWLEQLYEARKRTESTMDFVDLPGAMGEEEKAGLEKHLPTLRQADALCIIVRNFENAGVQPHRGRIDPKADVQEIREEMLFADLTICSGRIERVEAAAKKPTKDQEILKRELELLHRCRAALESSKPLRDVIQPGEEEKMMRSFGFLTQKPVVTVINMSEDASAQPAPFEDQQAFKTIALSAKLEAELMQMDPADRAVFMQDYGLTALARDRVIRACFDALDMIFFLTAGVEEVRAWPIPRGATAVEAAGRIHTDLAKNFIKAETIAYDEFVACGSVRDAKAQNKFRQEPKTYVVQDGDVLMIKHSG